MRIDAHQGAGSGSLGISAARTLASSNECRLAWLSWQNNQVRFR
jgi:hypothetical protein